MYIREYEYEMTIFNFLNSYWLSSSFQDIKKGVRLEGHLFVYCQL